ncbi:4'-phosphopantetheinyl transferase family protein [Brachybacterium sp. GU-2]|uniref:4'-phosphopantetheinyl transferase family protein n=1 Tax=Brachybacterium sp. GU-2 TaxID=3069708 RepID=UPI00280A8D4B|nr:4'-phosphopantetheinyl transferase superfamily protein [Brachybacterium sp. GU-2]WME22177.1 4'-phosphopantetheinyl transferase superfamily protein [Brachybacterium sp. GU-2]
MASRRHPAELEEREDLAPRSGADLRLHPVTADADRALAAHVADVVGVQPDELRVGRHCPACGSSAHGRPWARVVGTADGGAGTWGRADGRATAGRGAATSPRPVLGVSLSRSGPHLLTAVRLGGGLGVDLEEIAAVDRGWDPSLVLHPAEAGQDRSAEERARLWAGKEAVLKLLGTGLRTPMPEVRLADHDLREAEAPEGFVILVAQG